MQGVVILENAPDRALAFRHWFPDATYIACHRDQRIPDSLDRIILTGGYMSAFHEDRLQYPFLQEQYDFVCEARRSQKPVPILGICLGAQVVTLAVGGVVKTGAWVRGWNSISPTTIHPAFPSAASVEQFEFHQNHIVELPSSARVLARSVHDAVEAFAIDDKIICTAYHPEVTVSDAARIYSATSHLLTEEELHRQQFPVENAASSYLASKQLFDYFLSM
jgi:GMP synthase-like glutamine amidotransferase